MKSKLFTDKFCYWTHHFVGSGSHGDLVRFILGAGKDVSKQIEYMKQYGSANPEAQTTASQTTHNSTDSSNNVIGSDSNHHHRTEKENHTTVTSATPDNMMYQSRHKLFNENDGGNSEDIQGDEAYGNDPLPQQVYHTTETSVSGSNTRSNSDEKVSPTSDTTSSSTSTSTIVNDDDSIANKLNVNNNHNTETSGEHSETSSDSQH